MYWFNSNDIKPSSLDYFIIRTLTKTIVHLNIFYNAYSTIVFVYNN